MPLFEDLAGRRKHRRTHLSLPVRVRWRGPFGMRLEITQTINVSREGLLIHQMEPSETSERVWVAFPFDSSEETEVRPEIAARIVRVELAPAGDYHMALQLELPPRGRREPAGGERRAFARMPFSLPIFVMSAGSLWPEESMTRDISLSGARSETPQIYAPEKPVLVQIPSGVWFEAGERLGRVVRTEVMPEPATRAMIIDPRTGLDASVKFVAVKWTEPARNRRLANAIVSSKKTSHG